MKLNDAIMEETFAALDTENDPVLYRVYGVVTASAVKILLLGNLSAFANQYFLVGFSKTRMILIRLDMWGKPHEPAVIYFRDIRDVRITGWMCGLGKKLYFRLTDGSKICLKLNKINGSLKNQKEKLGSVCTLLSETLPGA